MISNNGLRLSYRTIPTSTFEIIKNLHLLEVLWCEEKSYWEDPIGEIFWVIATIQYLEKIFTRKAMLALL
jgi:hypothetical protein